MAKRKSYIETTPYGVEQQNGKWYVRQMWWGKNVLGPYDSKEIADKACIEEARANRCLKTRYA